MCLLKSNESLKITENIQVSHIDKVRFLFDFVSISNYPDKELKKGNAKNFYHFTRKIESKEIKKNFYINLCLNI